MLTASEAMALVWSIGLMSVELIVLGILAALTKPCFLSL